VQTTLGPGVGSMPEKMVPESRRTAFRDLSRTASATCAHAFPASGGAAAIAPRARRRTFITAPGRGVPPMTTSTFPG